MVEKLTQTFYLLLFYIVLLGEFGRSGGRRESKPILALGVPLSSNLAFIPNLTISKCISNLVLGHWLRTSSDSPLFMHFSKCSSSSSAFPPVKLDDIYMHLYVISPCIYAVYPVLSYLLKIIAPEILPYLSYTIIFHTLFVSSF